MKEWHPSTAQELFQSADDILAKYGVQWNNCTLLGVVNTNTNIGNQRTASEKSPAIKISVCTCHVPHNDAVKASSAFTKITKCGTEDRCVDLCCWFEKSSKQKSALEEYCLL